MKNQGILIILFIMLMNLGCGQEKHSHKSADATKTTDNGPGQNPGTSNGFGQWPFGGGASIGTDVTSLSDYTGITMTSEEALKVYFNVNVKLQSNGAYSGTVTVEYNSKGKRYVDTFKSGDQPEEYKNNKWVTIQNQQVWHGLFDDMRYGAVIVVFDKATGRGDGDGGPLSKASGRVYYKNFNSTAYHPSQYCWTFSKGPYSCQTWKSDVLDQYGVKVTRVDTTQAVYPYSEDGYKLLGTFENIELSKAFNE